MNDKNTEQQLAYSPRSVAAMLGLSKNLIYSMLKSGQLRSIRCGDSRKRLIIPLSAIYEFLENGEGQVPE